MIILGYIVLFFLAAFTRGVVNLTHATQPMVVIIWIGVGALGVYFLGWLSLLAFFAGSFSAGFVRFNENNQED